MKCHKVYKYLFIINHMEEENFEYNSEIDSLSIYNTDNTEDVIGSIVFGDLIFDINSNGDIISLEIDNASQFFNMPSVILSKIESAKIDVKKDRDMILLGFSVRLSEKEYNFSYIVPKDKIILTN